MGDHIDSAATVESGAKVDPTARVMAHAFVTRFVRLGAGCTVYPGVCLGLPAEDEYESRSERITSFVKIGRGTVIREQATVHRSTEAGHATVIGEHNYLMAQVQVGHDCRIGDHNVIVNCTSLGGFCRIGNHVYIGGHAALFPFVRVGDYAMIHVMSVVKRDVLPYMVVDRSGKIAAHNTECATRHGFDETRIRRIKAIYRLFYRSGNTFSEAVDQLRNMPDSEERDTVLKFVDRSHRGFCAGAS